jgi:hypothetical protein
MANAASRELSPGGLFLVGERLLPDCRRYRIAQLCGITGYLGHNQMRARNLISCERRE